MKLTRPRALEPGMTIGLVAPSGAPRDTTAIDRGAAALEARGYKVSVGKNARKRLGYLAGSDKERLDDLHRAFADKKIDAVLCVRGGYGTSRIADHIDYDLIKSNPKIFCGFSDITYLGLAFLRLSNLVTFNGAMATSTWASASITDYTKDSFWRVVERREPLGSVWQGHADRHYRVVRPGEATGHLVGGNLSLVAAAAGTRFALKGKGAIVFLEDIDERAYRIDRMLTQLVSSGAFDGAAAIVFGRNVADPTEREREQKAIDAGLPKRTTGFPAKQPSDDWEPTMDEVIHDRLAPLGIPVLIGLPFGHIDSYCTLPIGVKARVDSRTGELEVLESAVK